MSSGSVNSFQEKRCELRGDSRAAKVQQPAVETEGKRALDMGMTGAVGGGYCPEARALLASDGIGGTACRTDLFRVASYGGSLGAAPIPPRFDDLFEELIGTGIGVRVDISGTLEKGNEHHTLGLEGLEVEFPCGNSQVQQPAVETEGELKLDMGMAGAIGAGIAL
jgi:hypothetical protein